MLVSNVSYSCFKFQNILLPPLKNSPADKSFVCNHFTKLIYFAFFLVTLSVIKGKYYIKLTTFHQCKIMQVEIWNIFVIRLLKEPFKIDYLCLRNTSVHAKRVVSSVLIRNWPTSFLKKIVVKEINNFCTVNYCDIISILLQVKCYLYVGTVCNYSVLFVS